MMHRQKNIKLPEGDFQLLNASGINVQKLSKYDIFKHFVTCSVCQ